MMEKGTLRGMLEKRSGHHITSAADCEWLALDLKAKLGEAVSVRTLKRYIEITNKMTKAAAEMQ